jgi:radical SAM-linked protein
MDVVQKLRFTLEKRGKLRFLSHLDWLRMLYRAVAQSGLPLAYTQGFNPKPKISVGAPLPLFWDGLAEHLDIALSESVSSKFLPEELLSRLNQHLPSDGKAIAVEVLAPTAPSIDKQTRQVKYLLRPPADLEPSCQDRLQKRVAAWSTHAEPLMFTPLAEDDKVPAEPVNLRPFIAEMMWTQEGLQLSIHKPKVQDPLPVWAKPQWILASLLDQDINAALNWRVTRLGVILG